ncbi:hypothetical protein LSTR_LSTR004250, partial [Laodelphax striatellus]
MGERSLSFQESMIDQGNNLLDVQGGGAESLSRSHDNVRSNAGQQLRLGWIASSTTGNTSTSKQEPAKSLESFERELRLLGPRYRPATKAPTHLALFPQGLPGIGQDRRLTILSPHSPTKQFPGMPVTPSAATLDRWHFSTQTLRTRRKVATVLPRIILPEPEDGMG